MNDKEDISAFIHTLQLSSAEFPKQDKAYIKGNPKPTLRGILTPINPNTYTGYDIGSFAELELRLDEITDDMQIYDYYIDRTDIAVDIKKPYQDLRKINKYLINLFALYMRNKNVTERIGASDLKSRSLYVRGRKYAFEIYDKELESNGKRRVTRCEFRFLLLKKDTDVFNELYKMLDSLSSQIDRLNQTMIDTLYNTWLRESNPEVEGGVNTLPEFFKRYAVDITTPAIARGLHDKILPGKYENWIKKFRSKHKITFIPKSQINAYCAHLKAAIKSYEKAPCYTLRWYPKGVPFEDKILSE